MFTIKVHKRIEQIISVFYILGLWHDQSRINCGKWNISVLHLVIYIYYPCSLVVGSLESDNDMEKIFLGAMSIVSGLAAVRLFYFIREKDAILTFIRTVGVHTIRSEKKFHQINGELNMFMKFASYFELNCMGAVVSLIIMALPFFTAERRLPFNIFIPYLDWRAHGIYYWIFYAYVAYGALMTLVCTLFIVIIWYLMISLVIEYEILGDTIENVGWIRKDNLGHNAVLKKGKSDQFLQELIVLIKKHRDIQE